MPTFDPITTARLLLCDQATESLQRTRKIMARCFPNWQLPKGSPFFDDHARAVMTSPFRSDYILFQRRMAKEISARILAKIKARDCAENVSGWREEAIARPAHYSLGAVAWS